MVLTVADVCGNPAGIDEAEAMFVGNKHDVEDLYVLVREDDWGKFSLLVALRPDDRRVVVAEVIEERQIEGDVVGLVVVPDLSGLVAVRYGN
jgi:hypothetical protein